MNDEQRRADDCRFPVRVVTRIEQAWPGRHTSAGFTEDLSRAGAHLHLNRAAILGAPVRVTMNLSPWAELNILGTVVWARAIEDILGWKVEIQFQEELPRALVAEVLGRLRVPEPERARGRYGIGSGATAGQAPPPSFACPDPR